MIQNIKDILIIVVTIVGLICFFKLMIRPKQSKKSNKYFNQKKLQNEETCQEILWDCEAERNDKVRFTFKGISPN